MIDDQLVLLPVLKQLFLFTTHKTCCILQYFLHNIGKWDGFGWLENLQMNHTKSLIVLVYLQLLVTTRSKYSSDSSSEVVAEDKPALRSA